MKITRSRLRDAVMRLPDLVSIKIGCWRCEKTHLAMKKKKNLKNQNRHIHNNWRAILKTLTKLRIDDKNSWFWFKINGDWSMAKNKYRLRQSINHQLLSTLTPIWPCHNSSDDDLRSTIHSGHFSWHLISLQFTFNEKTRERNNNKNKIKK